MPYCSTRHFLGHFDIKKPKYKPLLNDTDFVTITNFVSLLSQWASDVVQVK